MGFPFSLPQVLTNSKRDNLDEESEETEQRAEYVGQDIVRDGKKQCHKRNAST
jgi:hypothetical protein